MKQATMKTRDEILATLRAARAELQAKYHVNTLALFGSYARCEQQPGSDIDILVDVPSGIGLGFVELADTIEAILGVPTDVISRRAVKPRHWRYIEPESSRS